MEFTLRSNSTKSALISLAVAAAVALAGCGSNDTDAPAAQTAPAASSAPAGNGVAALGADEILKRAETALKDAKSFHAKGATSQDGQKINIDLKVSGADFAATMAFDKAKVDLLAAGGKKYLRPNEEFFVMSTDAQQGKALAEVINDRWIIGADADDSFKDLFGIADVNEMLKPTGTISKGAEKQIAGVPAITLNDSGDKGSALYVATTGEPYPLQMLSSDGSTIDFDSFGETFTGITAPAEKDVVDMNKLGAK